MDSTRKRTKTDSKSRGAKLQKTKTAGRYSLRKGTNGREGGGGQSKRVAGAISEHTRGRKVRHIETSQRGKPCRKEKASCEPRTHETNLPSAARKERRTDRLPIATARSSGIRPKTKSGLRAAKKLQSPDFKEN